MPNLLTSIASQVLTTTAASVTFSAIPGTYTDLMLKVSVRRAEAGRQDFRMYFNADATNNSFTRLEGDGATATNGRGGTYLTITNLVPSTNETASTFGVAEIYIPNYVGAALKPVSMFGAMETNATTAYIQATAGLWNYGAATITTVTLLMAAGNFVAGSRFDLYGILKA